MFYESPQTHYAKLTFRVSHSKFAEIERGLREFTEKADGLETVNIARSETENTDSVPAFYVSYTDGAAYMALCIVAGKETGYEGAYEVSSLTNGDGHVAALQDCTELVEQDECVP